jgi:hypothetical protein
MRLAKTATLMVPAARAMVPVCCWEDWLKR